MNRSTAIDPSANGNGNPILTAYESFVEQTPLVIRSTVTTLSVSYLLSYFLDTSTSLGNVPHFTILRLELYRLVVSPFLCCDSLFTLLIAYWSLTSDQIKRLEFGMGSTAFATLLLTIGTLVNTVVTLLCILRWLLTDDVTVMFGASTGIWTVLFAIISLDCSMEYRRQTSASRRLFGAITMPTLYYPIIILFLFLLFGLEPTTSVGFSQFIAYILSTLMGYAYGFQKINFLKLGYTRRRHWEKGCLRKITDCHGFVYGPTGASSSSTDNRDDATWDEDAANSNAMGSGLAMPHQQQQQQQGWTPTMVSNPNTTTSTSSTNNNSQSRFSGHGQKLGNPVRRSNTTSSTTSNNTDVITDNSTATSSSSSREAILAAAERRAKTKAIMSPSQGAGECINDGVHGGDEEMGNMQS